MTINDDSSIYVGGLSYDATEETVRDAFDLYGGIVAIKIVNDRAIGGKCYGFVTFRNPRSAVDAINDMNGRTIDGMVVRVSEVRSRGGRSNFGGQLFRRNYEREMNWEEREYDEERFHRAHSRDHGMDRERGYDYTHDRDRDRDRSREHYIDRDVDEDRELEEIDQGHNRKSERGFERIRDFDREIDESSDRDRDGYKHRDQHSKKQNGSDFNVRRSSDLSSDSCDDFHQIKEQMEISNQRLEELQKEIPEMEEMLEEKEKHVLDLQKKSQKLEDALTGAKKLSSYRRSQLSKVQRCFMQVNDYTEKLKNSEHQLQSLVDATMVEIDVGGNDV